MGSYALLILILTLLQAIIIVLPMSSEYIQLYFQFSFHSIANVPFLFGESNLSMLFLPDLNSSYSIVNEFFLYEPDNKSREGRIVNDNIEFTLNHFPKQGKVVESQFKPKQDKSKPIQLYYYMTSNYSQGYRSSLGLGSSFSDDKYSVIHQLERRGFINKLSFGFIMDQQMSNGMIIGSIPNEYIANKTHAVIDIIGLSFHWDFNLISVMLTNTSNVMHYSKASYAYLVSLDEYIYTPSDFYDILLNEFFKDAISSRTCYPQSSKPRRYLLCVKESSVRIGEVSFEIGRYTYLFKIDHFWNCGEDLCIFSMREGENENEWMFGFHFYNLFNTVFDYETKQVHLYVSNSSNLVQLIENQKYDNNWHNGINIKLLLNIVLIINILCLSFGVLYIIGLKYKVK